MTTLTPAVSCTEVTRERLPGGPLVVQKTYPEYQLACQKESFIYFISTQLQGLSSELNHRLTFLYRHGVEFAASQPRVHTVVGFFLLTLCKSIESLLF